MYMYMYMLEIGTEKERRHVVDCEIDGDRVEMKQMGWNVVTWQHGRSWPLGLVLWT